MVGVPGRPGLLRALNDASILGLLIDHGPLTRAAIAARSDLSKPTVAESLTRLQTSSFVAPMVGSGRYVPTLRTRLPCGSPKPSAASSSPMSRAR
jgi:DNA-binding IclR family transcriptional regulator